MKPLLKPIKEDEFKKLVSIRFKQINEGFLKFTNGILEPIDKNISKEEIINSNEINKDKNIFHNKTNTKQHNFKLNEMKIINFIKDIYFLNRNKPIIVDFYLKNLDSESLKNLIKLLDEDDKDILLSHIANIKDDTIYFKLCEELIEFIVRLSTRELFFTTIYFLDMPLTVWGNYDMKFPLFFKNEEDVELYEKIAKKNGLKISSIIKI